MVVSVISTNRERNSIVDFVWVFSAMAASLHEIESLIYDINEEEITELLREGGNAILQIVSDKISAEGLDEQTFLDLFNNSSANNHKESIITRKPKQNTVLPTISNDVQPPVKNVKQEKKTSVSLRSTNDVGPMLPPKKPAPRAKKIKTEPPEEPHMSTRSRNTRDRSSNKESVIIQVPDIPLIDLTNKSISPRTTRSKVRQVTKQGNEKDDASEIQENKNKTDHEEEVLAKSKLNSGDKETTKDEQQVNANVTDKPSEKSPDENKKLFVQLDTTKPKVDLNQTYDLPSEPQTTDVSVPVKQPPKTINTPTKANKTFTPLKNPKTFIPKLLSKSPSSTSTPLGTFKASQKVLKSAQKQNGQESLRKKEEVLRALEKSNKKKDIELQREQEIREARMKHEAAKKLAEKKKAEEYLKKKQENMKTNPATGPSHKKEGNLIYMTKHTPLLPTVDCYDSDEEHKQPHHPEYPAWTQRKFLEREELVGSTTGRESINTLFIMKVATPDLREIFQRIDAKKLVRSSSAHWKRPPRYTLFEHHSNIYFSEDEDI